MSARAPVVESARVIRSGAAESPKEFFCNGKEPETMVNTMVNNGYYIVNDGYDMVIIWLITNPRGSMVLEYLPTLTPVCNLKSSQLVGKYSSTMDP